MESHEIVRDAFRQQSQWCARLGSPLTAKLMSVFAEHLDETTQTGRTLLNWGGSADPLGDAVSLRLAGALHALVRRGRLPELAALYPPNPLPGADQLAAVATQALHQADEVILDWLQHPPQTNETARSAALYAGFLSISHSTGLPLQLYELGASAGLNLIADRYRYNLGGLKVGAAGSPLTLAPEWEGPPPPNAAVEVLSRQGCDRAPLDVANDRHCERLIGYVWPDQAARLARVETAISLARKEAMSLTAAEAAEWVEAQISAAPVPGVTRVLFHSIAWQYFSADAQERITRRMEDAGKHATSAAPLAWLAFEQRAKKGPALSLRLWPGGHERVLATADAHVSKVIWLAA
ncbi:MAG: DUF2332 family protein [Pseudomonadota bacterium]